MSSVSGSSSLTFLAQRSSTLNSEMRAAARSTALRVAANAKRNNPAISQSAASVRSQQKSLAPVLSSLTAEASRVLASRATLGSVQTVLDQIKTQLGLATQDGADLGAIQARIQVLNTQLRSVAGGTSAAGVNLLMSNADPSSAGNSYAFLSALSGGANGGTTIHQQAIDLGATRLYDGSPAASGLLQRLLTGGPVAGLSSSAVAPSLSGLGGAATAFAGLEAGSLLSAAGLAGAGAQTNGKAAVDQAAKLVIDIANPAALSANDTAELRLNYNGNARTIKFLTGSSLPTSEGAQAAIQAAIDAAFGSNQLKAEVSEGLDLTITSVAKGPSQRLAVESFQIADGDTRSASVLGLGVDAGAHWVNNSTVDNQNRSSSFLNPNFSNLDRSGTLNFTLKSISAGSYQTSDGHYTANGTVQLFKISVSLRDVTNRDTLVAAINTALNASDAKDYFAAGLGNHYQSTTTQPLIYHKTQGSSIQVVSVGFNGDGTSSGAVAYTPTATSGGVVAAVAASTTTGSDFAGPIRLAGGGRLTFDLAINGTTKAVVVDEAAIEAALASDPTYVAGSGQIGTVAQYAQVVQRAIANGGVGNISVTTSGQRLVLTKTGTPADGDTVAVGNIQSVANGAARSVLRTGSEFNGPQVISPSGTLRFDLSSGSGSAKTVEITQATVDAALRSESGYVVGSGRIETAAQLAKVVAKGLEASGLTGVTVAASHNRLVFSRTATGAGTIQLSGVTSLSGWSDTSALTLEKIDVRAASFPDLRSDQRKAVINAMIEGVTARQQDIVNAEKYLQGVARRIEIQQSFTTGLNSILSTRLQQLVEPDMSGKKARQTASETSRRLTAEAMGMMTASQKSILDLFK